ncbi:MAG: TetR family transcriptional regulator, partial [Chloroflexota bacterium]
MKLASQADRPSVGLRERKKVKTFAAIQQQALRLFREQGYAATTVEQVAAAAEVSPSTVFRYFPTKEDLVLRDLYDPLFIAAFEAQPAELRPLPALRQAIRSVFANLPPEERAQQQERTALVRTVPELRAATLNELTGLVQMLTEVAARRVGRNANDTEVRTFAGAVLGVMIAVMLVAIDDPAANFFALIDESLA